MGNRPLRESLMAGRSGGRGWGPRTEPPGASQPIHSALYLEMVTTWRRHPSCLSAPSRTLSLSQQQGMDSHGLCEVQKGLSPGAQNSNSRSMCLAPHPPPPMCGTPAQVALGPAHVWPRHLVMNLQMNRTTLLSFSQSNGHPLPHGSFSLFNNEDQNGKGPQLQGPLGMRGGV